MLTERPEKMNRTIIKYAAVFITITILAALPLHGQYRDRENTRPPLRQRMVYGGSMGLQFGTITNIQLSPVVGVWLLPRLMTAAGPTWQYYKDPLGKTSVYGGRSFARFMFIQDINKLIPVGMRLGFYLHAEYEALSLEDNFWLLNGSSSRFWEHTALGGLGISQAFGIKSSFNITFMWTLTQSDFQIYDNPEIRIDFLF